MQGGINGVEGLELIGGNAARAMEPELACIGALHSPETGIIDGHRYMLALRGDLEDAGGAIAFNTKVDGAARKNGQWQVAFGGSGGGEFAFDAVANCAGLGAQAVARAMVDYPATRVPRLVLAKGNYFTFAGQAGVLAADLSDADRRRARRACHARSRRTHALRAGRRMGRA